MKTSGIYKITNIINNKLYIGQAKNIHLRWLEHKCRLRNNYADNSYLQNAWNKYGENAFSFEVLEECSISELNNREAFWMKELNSLDRKFGYNLSCQETNRTILSKETRTKISVANTGRQHSKERNKKISDSKKGIPRTQELKDKLSVYWKNKVKEKDYLNPMQGKIQSRETKRKIGEKARNRIRQLKKVLVFLDENNKEIKIISLKDGLLIYGTKIYYSIKNNKKVDGYFIEIRNKL